MKRGIQRYKLIDQELSIARVRAELDLVRDLADDLDSGRLTWKDDATLNTCDPHHQTADRSPHDAGASTEEKNL